MRTSNLVRFNSMVQKELLELMRSYKIIFVPLVFMLLGIMQPVSMYYMPLLLEKAGNMPEGTVINMPLPQGAEVLAQTLQQFGTLGLLMLVLVFMGTVGSERNSGTAALILVKPISELSYIVSKWIAALVLVWGSLIIGYFASLYYTNLLIGSVPLDDLVGSMFIYGLWLSFVLTTTIFFSTLLRSSAAAAFSALGTAAFLSLIANIFPKQLGWTPGSLSGFAYQAVSADVSDSTRLIVAIVSTILMVAAVLTTTALMLSRSSSIE